MISRLSAAVLWALSLAAGAAFVGIAILHVRAPAEIDYIEGVMMDHITRLAHGQAIYVAPSLSFVALAYMPGIAYVASLLARAFGPALWEPRLVSLVASLGIGALAAWIVRRETRSWTFATAAAGIYFMGFGTAGGGHYVVSRPDSLMLLLAFSGLAVLRWTSGARGAVIAALLLALAFFTKQHAIWFGAAALPHLGWNDRRRLVPFALSWLAACAGGYALLSMTLGPWFSFYTWDVPSHWSEFSALRIQRYLGPGLFGMLGPLTVPALFSLALPRERPWRGPAGIWAWTGLGAVGAGLLATLDPSAWHHVFIPSMVALSVLGPLSVHRIAAAFESAEPSSASRVRAVACLVLSLQFVPLVYGIHLELPHHGAARARDEFLARLRALPGSVIVVDHGFYGVRAGKPMALQIIAIGDLERSRGNRLVKRDPRALERLFDALRAGPGRPALVTDDPLQTEGPLWARLATGYRLADTLGASTAPLGGLRGHTGAPRFIYMPADSADGADRAGAGAGTGAATAAGAGRALAAPRAPDRARR